MSIPVIGLGAGGHAKVVIDILKLNTQYELIGLLDVRTDMQGQSVSGVPVIGGDEKLSGLKARGIGHFFMGLGGASDLAPRRRLYESALKQGLAPVSVIHPTAVISTSAIIGKGPTIMAGAIINAYARLGENVIINTRAVIEHDCIIGAHAHVATGAVLAGGINIGEGALIGAGAVIRQGINIGKNSIIGAGAVVVKDVPGGKTMIGNPARQLTRK